MPQGGARGQNLGHLYKVQISYQPFIRKRSSSDNWYHAWLASTRLLQMHGCMPELKNLGIFRFFGCRGRGIGVGAVSAKAGVYMSFRAFFSSYFTISFFPI